MPRILLPRQVGIVVASARKAKGLTQADVAQQAAVSRQLVNRLEMGTATGIALDKLLSILEAVGCGLDVYPLDEEVERQELGRVSPELDELLVEEVKAKYQIDQSLFECPSELLDNA